VAKQLYPVTIADLQFGPERLTQLAGVPLDLGHLSASAGFAVQVLLGQPVFKPTSAII
jgi:hypothetical protein